VSTFDDRERHTEKKFALDRELRSKAEARRNEAAWRMGGGQNTSVRTGRRELHQSHQQMPRNKGQQAGLS
jgi:hypothetical protein